MQSSLLPNASIVLPKFFMGKPSQNYGASIAIWDQMMLLAPDISEHSHLNLSQEGWYSIYLPRGWKTELT